MLKFGYIAVTILLLAAFLLATEPRAYAYVDPGTSLLMFQSISAMITGALFYFRRRLRSLIFRSERNGTKTDADRS